MFVCAARLNFVFPQPNKENFFGYKLKTENARAAGARPTGARKVQKYTWADKENVKLNNKTDAIKIK